VCDGVEIDTDEASILTRAQQRRIDSSQDALLRFATILEAHSKAAATAPTRGATVSKALVVHDEACRDASQRRLLRARGC
jgi:hypothetical protein